MLRETDTNTGAHRGARLFMAAVLLAGAVACGQKGPLQLPGMSKDTPWPVRMPEPAAAPKPPSCSAANPATPDANACTGAGTTAPATQGKP